MVLGQAPGSPGCRVTLDNWQIAPQLVWSFQHIEDIFATSRISRGTGPVTDLGLGRDATDPVAGMMVTQPDASVLSVADVMAATDTDGWMVWHNDVILAEHYPRGMKPETRHLLMSVSKSLVGMVAGAMISSGDLHPDRVITDYVPDLARSGYAGSTVRHLLDMRSGIHFSEDYHDPMAEVRLLEQAIGWAPRTHPTAPSTMYEFLTTLQQKGQHGGPFEYRSGETDVLGWVLEAAATQRMPVLMSELLWSRLGAEEDASIAIDAAGTGLFDGGVCASLRDLVRFGVLLVRDGASLTGEQVVPPSWIEDTVVGGVDSREAFSLSPSETLMPGGMYRNQFWLPYPGSDVVLCLGIHGQMIYMNRRAGMVAAKLSSWAEPQHAWKLFTTLRAFDAIAQSLMPSRPFVPACGPTAPCCSSRS